MKIFNLLSIKPLVNLIQKKSLNGQVIKTIQYGSALYKQSFRLRSEVLRENLGLPGFDPNDPKTKEMERGSTHIVYTKRQFPFSFRQQVIGALFVTPDREKEVARVRQVAVSPNHRGQGVAKKMMEYAETVASGQGLTTVALYARSGARKEDLAKFDEETLKSLNVVPFYEKLGYEAKGEPQEIPGMETMVVPMEKKLEA